MAEFFHGLMHDYHDILVAFVQLVMIAPLTAFFVDIYRRREMRASRRALIASVNYQVFELLVRGTQALRTIDSMFSYPTMLKAGLSTKKVLEEALASELPQENLAKLIATHNHEQEQWDRQQQACLDEAVYRFRTMEKLSDRAAAALVPGSGLFDPSESEILISISRRITQIGFNAADAAFFVQERGRGHNAPYPDNIIYPAVVENWRKFLSRFADRVPQSLSVRISQWISSVLFEGNPYQDFTHAELRELTKGYDKILADMITKTDRQSELFRMLGSNDLRYFEQTKVINSKAN